MTREEDVDVAARSAAGQTSSEELVDGNVGRIDEGVRLGLVALVVVAAALSFRFLGANWAILTVIPSMLAIGYLWLSIESHTDPLYVIFGIDTRHHHR